MMDSSDWMIGTYGAYFGSDNGFYNVWLDGKIDQVATFDAALLVRYSDIQWYVFNLGDDTI